jgi:threonine dehydrogenase-like Zn-dependent dehydrogenase
MNQASVKRHLPRLIEHIRAGRVDPKGIITHRIPLEDVSDAYHIFSGKLDHCIKTILVTPGARQMQAGTQAIAHAPMH